MIGREKELQYLRNLYQSNDFEYLVMYGRRVGKTTLLQKFSKQKNIIFSNYTNEQKLANYGILGGISRYFETFNPKNDNLLKEELRDTNIYNSILSAIAIGRNKVIDITNHIYEYKAKVSKYLTTLQTLRLKKNSAMWRRK